MQKISIITVNRNNADGLEKTILSVVRQSYPNIEYIIIDGNSTDQSVDIIKKYSGKINYWVAEPDKGVYDAMNKGIDIATGDWICFMNSGDFFYDDNVLVNIFDRNKNNIEDVDIIYGNTVVIAALLCIMSYPRSISEMPIDKPFCHQSCFINLKLHKDNKFNLKYKICADYDFFLRLYNQNYVFKYIDVTVSCFDSRDSMSSHNDYQVLLEHRLIKKQNKSFYISLIKNKLRRFAAAIYNTCCNYNSHLLMNKKKCAEKKKDVGWVKYTKEFLSDKFN